MFFKIANAVVILIIVVCWNRTCWLFSPYFWVSEFGKTTLKEERKMIKARENRKKPKKMPRVLKDYVMAIGAWVWEVGPRE